MFQLALSFKGRLLSVHPLGGRRLIIGRDSSCDLVIDSLAAAPRHVALEVVEGQVVLTALTQEFPVLRNGGRVQDALLKAGDRVLLGKHTLTLTDGSEQAIPEARITPRGIPPRESVREAARPAAYLQVQSGRHIGEILILTRAVTRLRRIGGSEVIISRRDWGYALSVMGEANRAYVGPDEVLGDQEVPLTHGARIEIDGVHCQFFQTATTSVAQVPRASTDQARVPVNPAARGLRA